MRISNEDENEDEHLLKSFLRVYQALSPYSSVLGGRDNGTAPQAGQYATVLGGEGNGALGNFSVVLGGENNSALWPHETAP